MSALTSLDREHFDPLTNPDKGCPYQIWSHGEILWSQTCSLQIKKLTNLKNVNINYTTKYNMNTMKYWIYFEPEQGAKAKVTQLKCCEYCL